MYSEYFLEARVIQQIWAKMGESAKKCMEMTILASYKLECLSVEMTLKQLSYCMKSSYMRDTETYKIKLLGWRTILVSGVDF